MILTNQKTAENRKKQGQQNDKIQCWYSRDQISANSFFVQNKIPFWFRIRNVKMLCLLYLQFTNPQKFITEY